MDRYDKNRDEGPIEDEMLVWQTVVALDAEMRARFPTEDPDEPVTLEVTPGLASERTTFVLVAGNLIAVIEDFVDRDPSDRDKEMFAKAREAQAREPVEIENRDQPWLV